MGIKSKLLLALIIISFLICISGVIYHLYFWAPESTWNESPNKVIIKSDPGCMHIDTNYIPTVQVWGYGRIIWIERDSEGRRTVFEGYITNNEMKQLVNRLISIGFFRFRFGNEKYCVGDFLTVELSSVLKRHSVSSENIELAELYGFLKTGAGVIKKEFIPETGLLFVHLVEDVGIPANTKAEFSWPYSEFGYDLEQVHIQNSGQSITGENLQFAWEVVNSGMAVVESNGEVYWIGIEIPGVSP